VDTQTKLSFIASAFFLALIAVSVSNSATGKAAWAAIGLACLIQALRLEIRQNQTRVQVEVEAEQEADPPDVDERLEKYVEAAPPRPRPPAGQTTFTRDELNRYFGPDAVVRVGKHELKVRELDE